MSIFQVNVKRQFQLSSFPSPIGLTEVTRNYSAKMLFQSFLREAIVSSSGTGRMAHACGRRGYKVTKCPSNILTHLLPDGSEEKAVDVSQGRHWSLLFFFIHHLVNTITVTKLHSQFHRSLLFFFIHHLVNTITVTKLHHNIIGPFSLLKTPSSQEHTNYIHNDITPVFSVTYTSWSTHAISFRRILVPSLLSHLPCGQQHKQLYSQ